MPLLPIRGPHRSAVIGACVSSLRRAPLLMGLLFGVLGCEGRPPPENPGPVNPCPSGTCGGGQVVRPEGSVRIAAFNVHRLFDTVCDSGKCGGSEYEALPTPGVFDAQVGRLASSLTTLDADIVLLSEVETQVGLDALQARLPEFPHAVLGETGGTASVDVAVLSAFPITSVGSHRDRVLTRPDGSTTRFSRELLEVHLDVNGKEVIVFAAHFRSKVDDDPGRRYAEADTTRTIVAQAAARAPKALVVMGGDLNDVPGSAPITAMERDGQLLRVAKDRPDDQTWTYVYSGQKQAIDHLFVANAAGGTYVPGSFRAAREGGGGFGGSDHSAVLADFLPSP
ncbi:endonuclease/exonuclease/phosphatase family protein [Myxococcus sp. CA051A]|uniref:Endonuclease/exonuclease/phosphatase family protein n=1 Tax=Myxococcus llanfairpwllgwyngyllgogerychwyrndrobwllllantysiliogogogochensis TaxID=2590453 RepID=A0A540WWY7_9BACT|nr:MULTISPECIES: endonuclease/exonuclease/phosphatase family protein [Myxococcus]NTX38638.1 endonuclease/exonuclease/phosphatase family protein [Myxococcus sp. CA033]NTX50393.1 endonuclease/exonuclease/phosphatase family protein [Myxococcus sp. CA039A]NTX62794.1 endonuclease/exonuclease/phosphatase family protein [Myxococcus sp. CA051A]TQF13525.1 endonuclease/exonuclease/phosphatase family protein [Myxococcus llanfairpwllgwyngyllgogerychwyrndrobwllllantysiliogogogochensis]